MHLRLGFPLALTLAAALACGGSSTPPATVGQASPAVVELGLALDELEGGIDKVEALNQADLPPGRVARATEALRSAERTVEPAVLVASGLTPAPVGTDGAAPETTAAPAPGAAPAEGGPAEADPAGAGPAGAGAAQAPPKPAPTAAASGTAP